MTEYLQLNCLYLLLIFVSMKVYARGKVTRPILFTILAVIILTAVFDSLINLSGVEAFNSSKLLGLYVWHAPVEDFAYAIGSVLLVTLLWEYYDKEK